MQHRQLSAFSHRQLVHSPQQLRRSPQAEQSPHSTAKGFTQSPSAPEPSPQEQEQSHSGKSKAQQFPQQMAQHGVPSFFLATRSLCRAPSSCRRIRSATTGPATRLPATTTSPAPPSTTLPSTTTSGLGATLAITCWELYTAQGSAGSIVRAAARDSNFCAPFT